MNRPKLSHLGNAVLAWASVGVLVALAAILALSGEYLWGGLAVLVALIDVVPAVLHRNWRVMPPWMLPALTVPPFIPRQPELFTEITGYVAIAAIGLTIAMYLSAFTAVEVTTQLGILIVVVTTMAIGTLWAGARGLFDLYLGTSYIGGLVALERDLLISIGSGIVAGIVFEVYFRERNYRGIRGLPIEEA